VAEPDTLRVAEWLVAGPLAVGSRELLVDPLAPHDPRTFVPQEGDSLPTWMAEGGWTHWTRQAPEGDRLTLAFEDTGWDALADQWGIAGLLSAGFAFGRFEVARAGSYVIEAARIGSLVLDGERFLGDPYGMGAFRVPVRLGAGPHNVLLRAGGAGPREVSFRLIAQPEPVAFLEGDLTLPDLVAGEGLDGWGAVPIVNASGGLLTGARLSFGDGVTIARASVPVPPLEPEMILKLPFPVRTPHAPVAGERCPQEIRVTTQAGSWSLPCSLRVRAPSDSRILTFRSAQDGSVQKYAVLPPAAGGAPPYALVLSLHGASVIPEPQVRSYAPKDWAYVIAPTNTRPYGFDWQDWGRLNAIATLDDALARFPIDPARVLLAGHSMGGHGTWHVGLAHADRFAALAPSAGWASFATYVPFTLRRDATDADPRLRELWERAMAPDNALAQMAHARGMPVFVLHGAADDNVPAFHGRMLAARAREAGAAVVYREVPAMGHWWDRPETPGVDCVDDPEMMAFLRAQRPASPADSIFFRSEDLGTCDRRGWIRVDAAERRFCRIEVEARHAGPAPGAGRGDRTVERLRLRTQGAAGVTLALETILPAPDPDLRLEIEIDGQRLTPAWEGGSLSLRKERGSWRRVDAPLAGPVVGPLKAAFFRPFVLVYGTGGTSQETAAMRRLAVLDAQHWYLRADGFAPVLPDTAVTDSLSASANLVLYATPGTNRLFERIASRLPIRLGPAEVALDRARIGGRSLAVRFTHPNPLGASGGGSLLEIVAGTDMDGLVLATASNPCGSGTGLPDFLVYDAGVRTRGWSALRAAGYWNPDGSLPPVGEDFYLR
jgi:predicted esterase